MKYIRTRLDDIIAFAGFCFLSYGVFLWLGLPATLIFVGGICVYVGVRYEPDQTTGNEST
ncbi:MAG: hypothetical protein UY48_C0001G0012 [Candidatus Gottesmanbacteria bacterium GW2011_GWB1_49_7]|uniref:Uncharacterized protein n=1 Tax=Candidatus Gottesmanbacteria bacterium GW2011_GWB1_49_7 TaxID=1618448 RepID=A0A0G1W3P5_9BACT|nr:MAG: hypothetical protein UY48_C0001G0012 [Candidatus Gottesmanbacteria bacterium GW2011_GWB1_49_7]